MRRGSCRGGFGASDRVADRWAGVKTKRGGWWLVIDEEGETYALLERQPMWVDGSRGNARSGEGSKCGRRWCMVVRPREL